LVYFQVLEKKRCCFRRSHNCFDWWWWERFAWCWTHYEFCAAKG